MSLRVGIAGYGIVGKTRHRVLSQHQAFNVVAVSDINFKENPAEIDNVNTYYDYKDLIDKEDLDVLFVSLPNKLASEATLIGLKHGLHIFCEKPPAKTLEELYPIRDFLNENKDLKLMYGFNHRFHASIIDAINIIKDGSLGKVVNLRGVYGKSNMISFNQTDWRTKRSESGGGILLDQGIHMLDLMRLFSGEFKEIKSFISNDFWNHDVEDNAYALLKDEKGRVAMLNSSATQWQHKFNLEISLSKGHIELHGILSGSKSYGEERITIGKKSMENKNGLMETKTIKFLEDNSWRDEIFEFASVIIKDLPVESGTSNDALETMKLVFGIYYSDDVWKNKYDIKV